MNPLIWCRERLLVAGNPLAASLLFAPEKEKERILALRCLASEIAASASEISEPEVASSRLEWWRSALSEPDNPHPALRAVKESGADERLQPADFEPLVDGVAAAIEQPRFERFAELWQFCCRIGGSVSLLEARLLGVDDSDADSLRELGGAHYLTRVVRDLVIDARANRWLVPLDFQADYQVSRQDALEERPSPAFAGLVRAMLAESVGRGDKAVARMAASQRCRQVHLLAEWALGRRLARIIDRRPQRLFNERVLPGHWGNVWTAWRAARKALKA